MLCPFPYRGRTLWAIVELIRSPSSYTNILPHRVMHWQFSLPLPSFDVADAFQLTSHGRCAWTLKRCLQLKTWHGDIPRVECYKCVSQHNSVWREVMRCTRARRIVRVLWEDFHERAEESCRIFVSRCRCRQVEAGPCDCITFRTSLTLINDKWKMSEAVVTRQRWYFMCGILWILHSKSGCLPGKTPRRRKINVFSWQKKIIHKKPLRKVAHVAIHESIGNGKLLLVAKWCESFVLNRKKRICALERANQTRKNNEWSASNLALGNYELEKDKKLSLFPSDN